MSRISTPIPSANPLADAESAKKLTSRILVGAFAGLGVLGAGYTLLAALTPAWQLWILAGAAWFTFAGAGVIGSRLVSSLSLKILLSQALVALVFILTAGMVRNTSLFASPIILAFSILLAAAQPYPFQTSRIVNVGILFAVAASLVDVFALLVQADSLEVQILLGSLLAVVLATFAWLSYRNILALSMRIKLVVAGMVVALIPLVIISIFQAGFMTSSVTAANNQSLAAAAAQVAGKMDDFFNSNQATITNDSTLSSLVDYLNLQPNNRSGSLQENNLRITFESMQKRRQDNLISYGLLDSRGYNVFDTNASSMARSESTSRYFTVPMTTGMFYVSNIQFDPATNDKLIYFSCPIFNANHKVIGVLRSTFNAQELQRLASLYSGLLGSGTFPLVIDENGLRVADTLDPQNLYKNLTPLAASAAASLQEQQRLPLLPGDQISTNFTELGQAVANAKSQPFFTASLPLNRPIQVAGAIVSMKTKPWSVIYFQEQSVLADLQRQQIRITILIATLVAGLISIVATFMARLLTQPIASLTDSAARITAGDLDLTVSTTTRDEIGTLASAFNVMTARLRALVNDLEDRVRARTQELETQNRTLLFRNKQIQTVAEVARSIASAQDLESLLDQVTGLISQRFGFYHVGIFLVDEAGEFAVLRSANSEGGKHMLARQHRLKIGDVGIVGNVTFTGRPRITLNVGEDSVHFRNPDLPLTKSEMALPLVAAGKIIGALDVQSERTNAFTQDDIELFATLADQVAIAIVNSRLYEETAGALEEAQRLHRQYLRQEWARTAAETPVVGFSYTGHRLTPLYASSHQSEGGSQIRIEQRVEGNRAVSILHVPISLRGAPIGIILLKNEAGKEWDQAAVDTAGAIADQISQALENARLFEQTQRRADRERRVMEISSRIRAASDPETMLKIAAAELQHALNASARFVTPAGASDSMEPGFSVSGND